MSHFQPISLQNPQKLKKLRHQERYHCMLQFNLKKGKPSPDQQQHFRKRDVSETNASPALATALPQRCRPKISAKLDLRLPINTLIFVICQVFTCSFTLGLSFRISSHRSRISRFFYMGVDLLRLKNSFATSMLHLESDSQNVVHNACIVVSLIYTNIYSICMVGLCDSLVKCCNFKHLFNRLI